MKQRALVFAPHHDDESLGCGGVIAKLNSKDWGVYVTVIFAPLEEKSSEEYARRLQEASEAAKVLGFISAQDFLLPSRKQANIEELSWKLVHLIRQIRPVLVFLPHSDERDPEHQAAHRAVTEALWLSTSSFRADLGTPAPPINLVLGYEVWTPISRPTLIVDISEYLSVKLESLKCYKSQLEIIDLVSAAEGLAAYRGAMFGGCKAAEAFTVLQIQESAYPFTVLP